MDAWPLQQALLRFGIREKIICITPHIHHQGLDQQPPEYKLVAGLSFAGRPGLVIKRLKEERTSAESLQEQHLLTELFWRRGIPTARRLLTPEGQDHITATHQGQLLLVTLEEDIGPEISLATLALCEKAGALLGRMHRAAIQEGFHMKTGRAIFDWMRSSDVDAGEKLISLLKRHGRERESQAVKKLYEARRQALRGQWDKLPHFAVQGDLSINNLVRGADGGLKVFDYNCAGEASLVSDALLQALFFAREMPFDPLDAPSDWDARFTAFFTAYLMERPLTPAEESIWRSLYQAADAFWFTRYFYGEDTLDKQLEQEPGLALWPVLTEIEENLTKKPPL